MSEQKLNVPTELVNPAAQGAINALITNAVREVFLAMAPTLQSIALTPEKLAEAEKLRRAPDPAVVAREARERALMRQDLAEAEQRKLQIQANCTHKDANQKWSISLVHNYPDRQTRGICTHCFKWFEPMHWEIGAPDDKNPRGKAILVKESPDYHVVREIEAFAS